MEQKVIAQFLPWGILRNKEFYLKSPYAKAFINSCSEQNLAIVGIEVFVVEVGKIKPLLESIADYSNTSANDWDAFRKICNDSAIKFVHKLAGEKIAFKELLFNFTLLDNQEYLNIK